MRGRNALISLGQCGECVLVVDGDSGSRRFLEAAATAARREGLATAATTEAA